MNVFVYHKGSNAYCNQF